MVLVDTSAWVEFLVGSVTGSKIAQLLPKQEHWLVSTIVQFELAKWHAREGDDNRTAKTMAFSQTCVVAPLTSNLAYAAAQFSKKFALATADAIIYATAHSFEAKLLTCDAHFENFPDVIYIKKANI